MRYAISQLKLSLDAALDAPVELRRQVAKLCACAPDALPLPQIVRRSLDSRGRHAPFFLYTVEFDLPDSLAAPSGARPLRPQDRPTPLRVREPRRRPVIIGSGPAGLFCALILAESGVRSVILERGAKVERRKHDVAALYRRGELNPESNVCFGEGGAGTFTDGKLSTQVRDRGVREVFERLVVAGANPEILVTNKPHLGSERLPGIVEKIREGLLAAGVEFRFDTKVEDLIVESAKITGVKLELGDPLSSDRVVLAAGGSARELYRALAKIPKLFEAKDFAVGLRVEHPQALINQIQFGQHAGHSALPPADYKLSAQAEGRGVYAFCMCPGGVVVPTPTEEGKLCINGMSGSMRSSRWANSALVAQVRQRELESFGFPGGVLAGLDFQEALEERAYQAGGGGFVAPSSSVQSFVAKRSELAPGRSAYPRGLTPAPLAELFPEAISESLRQAVGRFSKMMRGFDASEARLIGVESRTSAPLSFPRDPHSLQSPQLAGLYPCGEGCGHAGGIVSAALDGMRVARAILKELSVA